jgi:hypothetical protein
MIDNPFTPARKAFLAEEHAREVEQRIADEAKRRTAVRAKTAHLKAMREARDATLRQQKQAKKQSKP